MDLTKNSKVKFALQTLLFLSGAASLFAEPALNSRGAAIYEKQCAECHGKAGEGVEDKADDPLTGRKSIAELAGRIERTMPEDREDECVGEDAKAVAAYIFHAFYSLEARAHNEGVRIELARLTAPQHQNTVADLVGSFRGGYGRELKADEGLKGRYDGSIKEKAGQPATEGAKFERVDPAVRFDYGEGVPELPENTSFSPVAFNINWEGSLVAGETGVYEFAIKTRNGASLWINELDRDKKPVIDGWVAPNNEVREQKGSLFLLGGRAYPLRLEFFKYKEKAALIELLWKPPYGVWETLPARMTRVDRAAQSSIVSTPFPADDRGVGYERGTDVSKAWFDAVTQAAIETADDIVDHLDQLAGTKPDAPDRAKKIGEFGVEFTSRAFRRPLSEEDRKRIVDARFDESKSLEQAVKRLVLLVLTSPEFLYPSLSEQPKPDSWDLAARLSLMLWDSIPDQRLRNLANEGKLTEINPIRGEARRMLQDPRARAKMRGFFRHWLELERADELAKDTATFPEFNDALLADLRTSLWLFLDDAVWGEGSNYQQLLTADYLYLNSRLAGVYGPDNAKIEGDGFQRVALDPKMRSGVVTHPFLLTAFAYHNNSSPIHRGVFLTRNIVGMTLNSPPEANLFEDSKFTPDQTMREKVTELTRAKACQGCHTTINPLGFSLEHYDGIGRWRVKDQGKPVNAQSDFRTDTGETLKLTGARDVAQFAASRPSAHVAFVEQLFHHVVKQPALAYGDGTLGRLREGFEKSGFNIQELLMEIAVTAAMRPESGNTDS